MSCKHKEKDCVCKIIKRIADRQQAVAQANNCCDVSCETSLDQLISPTGVTNDTVPFKLTCSADLNESYDPVGVVKIDVNGTTCFGYVESEYFRVKKMISDCCAILEILCPIKTGSGRIVGFYRTGGCVTVDLNCFCTITCLPPVRTEVPADVTTLNCFRYPL